MDLNVEIPPQESVRFDPASAPVGMVHATVVDSAPSSVGVEAESRAPVFRPTVEFLIVLMASVLLFRTFAAEAYIVPTGSMAPTLLGLHKDVTCTNCKIRFALGMDESGRSGRPLCPNCGEADLERAPSLECNGDRLLVQKFLYEWRSPRRWEVAVFQNPLEPAEAYVKRVVGLPGDSVLISHGDLYINDKIARKTLDEQRAMRILVYDNNYLPRDAGRTRRWAFRRFGPQKPLVSGWKAKGTAFRRDPVGDEGREIDWLEYRHRDPDRGSYGPIRDFTPYNGGEARAENRVEDVMLDASVSVRPEVRLLLVRIQTGPERYVVSIPVDGRDPVKLERNGRTLPIEGARGGLASTPSSSPRPARLEVSWMDHRLSVALDGVLLFDPFDDDGHSPPGSGRSPFASPLAVGVIGSGGAEVDDIQIYRDVYYTSELANAPRRPFGVRSPYVLGDREYFVLGDNSPVSNDSRFWPGSPVVHANLLLGKPLMVHLPSRGFPLKVFGRETYWVPDPRAIRYIR